MFPVQQDQDEKLQWVRDALPGTWLLACQPDHVGVQADSVMPAVTPDQIVKWEFSGLGFDPSR